MTNKHDYTDVPVKAATRQATLDIVRQTTLVHPNTGALRYDWMELCSEADPTCGLLVREGLLPASGPAKYIGINYGRGKDANPSKALLAGNEALYAGHRALWEFKDIRSAVLDHPRVGVLVYDTFYTLANPNLIPEVLDPVVTFAKEQHRSLGQFLLVLNFSLRSCHKQSESEVYRKAYLDYLRGHFGPSVSLTDMQEYTGKVVPMLMCRVGLGVYKL